MREDIQYEMLHHVFTDEKKAFTDPPREGTTPSTEKLTFGQLYIKEVINSPRCAKSHREAMTRSPDYARDYAMMCLLVNVGRCNTTLACESTHVLQVS
jgi:Ino eighty subunit 1